MRGMVPVEASVARRRSVFHFNKVLLPLIHAVNVRSRIDLESRFLFKKTNLFVFLL